MNIFKILNTGDGRINEPNVSAFLGYLLNPKAEHGLRDELLKRILSELFNNYEQNGLNNSSVNSLQFLVDKSKRIRNLSIQSVFEVEVLLEQAFQSEDKDGRKIVDIVILCYEKKVKTKESLAKFILSNNTKGELKQIFLIENKIKDKSITEEQLINQAQATIDTLRKILPNEEKGAVESKVSLIYITPEGENSTEEYKRLQASNIKIPSIHLYWDKYREDEIEENKSSIVNYLKDILENELTGKIEAINEYTKYTLKSFISFVENDFKSAIQEELEGGPRGKDVYDQLVELESNHPALLNPDVWRNAKAFDSALGSKGYNTSTQHSPRHVISVFFSRGKRGKIFSLTRINNDKLSVQIVTASYPISEDKDELKAYISEKGFEVRKDENWGFEIRSDVFNLDAALDIFDKRYKLL